MENMEKMTRVVNIKEVGPTGYDEYIGWKGRYKWQGEWQYLKNSVWLNPYNKAFRNKEITREESIENYKRYLLEERPDLVAQLPELKGKVVACWCKPKACHGDVLAELADAT
jgi:hypothetical protein